MLHESRKHPGINVGPAGAWGEGGKPLACCPRPMVIPGSSGSKARAFCDRLCWSLNNCETGFEFLFRNSKPVSVSDSESEAELTLEGALSRLAGAHAEGVGRE